MTLAALLALDSTPVLVALISALGLVAVAIVGLFNGRVARRADKTVDRIERELKPNGGSTAWDQLARRLDSLDEAIEDIRATVHIVVHELATEKVRAQFAEAELSARLEHHHPPHPRTPPEATP